MKIVIYELRKIVFSPIFIGVTVVFLLYNTLLIAQKKQLCDDVNTLNDIACTMGYKIDDNMLSDFKQYYENTLNSTNDYLKSRGFETYDTVGRFLDKNDVYVGDNSKFSKSDVKKLQKAAVTESYYFLSKSFDGSSSLNPAAMIKNLEYLKYNDKVKSFMKKNYEEAAARVTEIKDNNEQKNLFFYGKQYGMHSFLFKDIFKAVIYEAMILVVLGTSYVLNYEFESKLSPVVYASRRGRKILRDKLKASLIFTTLILTVIMSATLLIYFIVFDYSSVIHSTVNSFLSQETITPYATWYSMSYMKEIILSVVVIYIFEILFCMMSFAIQSFVKNTYMDFVIFAVTGGLLMILPSLISERFSAVLYSVYTPFTMIINPSWWFTIRDTLLSSKNYEAVTLAIWIIGMAVLSFAMMLKFKKEDVRQG